MLLFRLVPQARTGPLCGDHARRCPGRWHPGGEAVIYCATSLALAIVEKGFATARADPAAWRVVVLDVPASAIERIDLRALPVTWRVRPPAWPSRRLGLAWLRSLRSLALAVPSARVPGAWNVLLNPLHPGRTAVRVVGMRDYHP
jgi:RES domain-containing protein